MNNSIRTNSEDVNRFKEDVGGILGIAAQLKDNLSLFDSVLHKLDLTDNKLNESISAANDADIHLDDIQNRTELLIDELENDLSDYEDELSDIRSSMDENDDSFDLMNEEAAIEAKIQETRDRICCEKDRLRRLDMVRKKLSAQRIKLVDNKELTSSEKSICENYRIDA